MQFRCIAMMSTLALLLALGGCAHPISLGPDMSKMPSASGAKLDTKVGLVLSDADAQREVVTAGGGGDKVSYQPYRDLAPVLYKAFAEVYSDVVKVSSPADPKVAASQVQYLVVPRITTSSSSSSALTWPPTHFSIELECAVLNAGGGAVTTLSTRGEGHAEFDEFKSDTSLSARRASQALMSRLVELLRSKPLKAGP